MQMIKITNITAFRLCTLSISIFLLPSFASGSIGEGIPLMLENGVEVKIFDSRTVMERMTSRDADGNLVFTVPGGPGYRLIEDINDPCITNKGDGSFHAVKPAWVLQALREIDLQGRDMEMSVEVYLLPYPRYGILSCSASGSMIFLSPGVYEVGRKLVAYMVTHEFGHTFHAGYLPDDEVEGWRNYLRIRQILGNSDYVPDGPHVNRPKEIFAEDFRYLFGGPDSRYSGTIENPRLPLPDQVPELEEYILSLAGATELIYAEKAPMPGGREALALSNYPNPFNPSTTIRVVLGGEASSTSRNAELGIYAVDGSLVRNLYRGPVTGNEMVIRWNGRDDLGGPVGTGAYFYRFRSGNLVGTGKMLLVR